MKKKYFLIAVLFIGAICFSGDLYAFASNCLDYAMAAMVDEQEMYGYIHDRGEYLDGLTFYYDACEAGGASDPVFL